MSIEDHPRQQHNNQQHPQRQDQLHDAQSRPQGHRRDQQAHAKKVSGVPGGHATLPMKKKKGPSRVHNQRAPVIQAEEHSLGADVSETAVPTPSVAAALKPKQKRQPPQSQQHSTQQSEPQQQEGEKKKAHATDSASGPLSSGARVVEKEESPFVLVLTKKTRALKKKLDRIKALEEARDDQKKAAILNEEQMALVASKEGLQRSLHETEGVKAALMEVAKEEEVKLAARHVEEEKKIALRKTQHLQQELKLQQLQQQEAKLQLKVVEQQKEIERQKAAVHVAREEAARASDAAAAATPPLHLIMEQVERLFRVIHVYRSCLEMNTPANQLLGLDVFAKVLLGQASPSEASFDAKLEHAVKWAGHYLIATSLPPGPGATEAGLVVQEEAKRLEFAPGMTVGAMEAHLKHLLGRFSQPKPASVPAFPPSPASGPPVPVQAMAGLSIKEENGSPRRKEASWELVEAPNQEEVRQHLALQAILQKREQDEALGPDVKREEGGGEGADGNSSLPLGRLVNPTGDKGRPVEDGFQKQNTLTGPGKRTQPRTYHKPSRSHGPQSRRAMRGENAATVNGGTDTLVDAVAVAASAESSMAGVQTPTAVGPVATRKTDAGSQVSKQNAIKKEAKATGNVEAYPAGYGGNGPRRGPRRTGGQGGGRGQGGMKKDGGGNKREGIPSTPYVPHAPQTTAGSGNLGH
ncbi:hypothetical protein Naga_100002g155 [Nannochloropsis gaditana]|uniref:Uncharacterized protein n=1 Tax=Nannochloropsis gaditana TaxID=72520 RepID=W7U7C5_9STRA|nr:hypothetical protein Naga_100002g155 [Nannochloropsis gaditana]